MNKVLQISTLAILTLFWPVFTIALEALSEDEMYDTSGQASPTVSIKYSDDLTVDYFNQNVVVFESKGETSISFDKVYYKASPESTTFLALVWPDSAKFILEFDKYPNYPLGIGVSVSDILRTGQDGKPLSKFYDPGAPAALPANTSYLRTKPAPATVRTVANKFYIALAKGESGVEGEPDWDEAEKHGKLLYIYNSGSQRMEIMGYAYVWGRETSWGLKNLGSR
ncbi:MAG: hypothetical protein ACOZF0_20825 [Thermodesulfobacteriota bacterium]